MNIKQILLKEITQLSQSPYIDKEQYEKGRRIILSQDGLIKHENRLHHFCCFFVPLHLPSRSTYLVHHIKADGWIPPGGHIDPNETPIATVKREFWEELNFKLTDEMISLFNMSVTHIEQPKTCVTHYDLWYTVLCKECTPFVYLKKEFYDAGWFSIEKAIQKAKRNNEKSMFQKIKSNLMSSSA